MKVWVQRSALWSSLMPSSLLNSPLSYASTVSGNQGLNELKLFKGEIYISKTWACLITFLFSAYQTSLSLEKWKTRTKNRNVIDS